MIRELLILTFDAPEPGAPKRGDVIGMRPRGFVWGRLQHLGTGFLVVSMDLADQQAESLLEEWPGIMPDGIDATYRTSFVAYWEALSPVELATIAASEWLVVTLSPATIRSR